MLRKQFPEHIRRNNGKGKRRRKAKLVEFKWNRPEYISAEVNNQKLNDGNSRHDDQKGLVFA